MGDIDDLAFRIDELLSAHIAIHNDLFKFSLRKILPLPFLFRPVNFGRQFVQLALIRESLRECNVSTEKLQSAYPPNGAEVAFLLACQNYLDALMGAAFALATICAGLAGKSEEVAKYKWTKYKLDVGQYQEKVNAYRERGSVMNRLYHSTYQAK